MLISTFVKDDYEGAVLDGLNTGFLSLHDFGIEGPGQFEGAGNKGINLHIDGDNEHGGINPSIAVYNLYLTLLSDACIYAGTCSFVTWLNVKCFEFGFAGIWIDGGDGHVGIGCSVRNGIKGFYIMADVGFGPTSMKFEGCYAEQCGTQWHIKNGKAITVDACSAEASIDRRTVSDPDNENIGNSFVIDDGDMIEFRNFMMRQDTIGVEIPAPYGVVKGGATGVLLDGMWIVPSADVEHEQPTVQLHCSAAAANGVRLGRHNFDTSKITHGGKVFTFDLTALA
jgi:hypothetical protein